MTKEELKKEAIQYAVDYPTSYGKGYKHKDLRIAYLAGAEPREKQIQIDAEQIRALQKQNGELTDKVKKLEEELEQAKKVKVVEHFEAYGQCRDSRRIAELEAQIEKMKKYGKLLQDICTVMGNDIYMVSVGLENRVKVLWDSSEEKDGLKMVEDIENRLLKIKPQDWAEIEKWEIKEK